MKIAYFDAFSGASGDMILAALLDAGLPLEQLDKALANLNLPGYSLSTSREIRHGITATRFVVHLDHNHEPAAEEPQAAPHDHQHPHKHEHPHGHEHPHKHDHADDAAHGHSRDHGHNHEHHKHHDHDHKHKHDHDQSQGHSHDHGHSHEAGHGHSHEHQRSWAEIRPMIEAANLPPRAARRATDIFQKLAEAEAAVHGSTPEEVHFHEVGAVDSIVDIVGAALALELLGIDKVYASAIPPGSGTVRCAHGLLPVPAPATALLLRGVPTRPSTEPGELTTPTGAAILATLAEGFGPMPAMTPQAIGVGTGTRPGKTIPNIMRVFIGQAGPAEEAATDDGLEHDRVCIIEANLDDATAEVIADAATRLLAAGALDVYTTPIMMKKGRSAVMLSCLARPDQRQQMQQLLFDHTTTFGLRHYTAERSMLRRQHQTVETAFGPLRIKLGLRGQETVRVAPEYEDCRRAAEAAEAAGTSVQQVMQAALLAWHGGDKAANSGRK